MTRLVILQALQLQLQTILQQNKYLTNLGQNIKYWQVYDQDYNGEPCLTFRDLEAQYQFNNTLYINLLTVEIEVIGYVTESTKLIDSCNILEDIKTAIIKQQWTDSIIATRPKADSKTIQGKGKQAISLIFTVEIEYREDAFL